VVALLCPVPTCRLPLSRGERRLSCRRKHSFDVARSGYVNLLQVRDRRSRHPGDSVDAVQARQRLFDRGAEAPLVDAMAGLLTLTPADALLDVGCGDGQYLAAVVARCGCEGHGVDISVGAIEAAAKRCPGLHWVVANADRLLPYADASFRAVASITGRRNAGELRRVLRRDGTLLVVVPAPDDLIELREAILGEGRMHDRVETAIKAFAPHFALAGHERLRHVARLDAGAVRDVLTSSYRGLRTGQRARVDALGELDVTLSRDALLFRPAGRVAR
jgi:23S rRNA (guanine745-N1)-methyltransferase